MMNGVDGVTTRWNFHNGMYLSNDAHLRCRPLVLLMVLNEQFGWRWVAVLDLEASDKLLVCLLVVCF